jgi:FkbM family methyltransferase
LAELFLQAVQSKKTFVSLVDEVRAVRALIPHERPVLVDAGAHRGNWTKTLIAELQLSKPLLYLVEPEQSNLAVLRAMQNENCRVLPYALSDREGEQLLFVSSEAPYLQTLFERRIDHERVRMSGMQTVATISVDELMNRERLARIDLLKMDIEGAEFVALKGARRAIESGAIRAITFEVGPCNVDARVFFKDFWYFFKERDYSVFRIMHGGWLHPIECYNESLECFQKSNYVAIAPDSARAGGSD